MKNLFILLLFIFFSVISYSQTTLTADKVGIGIQTPRARFHLKGVGVGSLLIAELPIHHGYAGISMNDSLEGNNFNITSSPNDKNLYLNRPTANGMYFRENNVSQFVL